MRTFTKLNCAFALAALAMTGLYSCKKSNETVAPKAPVVAQTTGNIAIALTAKSKDSVLIMNVCPAGPRPDTLTFDALPTPVSNYLTLNYLGYTFRKAFQVTNSGNVDSYVVVINYNNRPIALKFNAQGTFTSVLEQREPADLSGPGYHKGGRFENRDGKCQDTLVISALPALVKTYMTANYVHDTLLHAVVTKDTSYIVFSTNSALYATTFSSKGAFVKRLTLNTTVSKHVTVAASALLTPIVSYLNTAYPGYVIHKVFAEKTKKGTIIDKYLVFIDANNTHFMLQFSQAGAFVKVVVIK